MTKRGIALCVLGMLLAAAPSSAQVRLRNSSEAQLLRDAAARESRGDLEGAAEVLRRLLESDPGSPGGLFALERVLRASGEIGTILPEVDAFLAVDPESSGVRSLKLRVLAETGAEDDLRREADAWLAADGGSEVPHREVARVYERTFGAEEALRVLRAGREEVGAPDALALELGDLLAASGELGSAADEWALAVGDDAAHVATVTRRLQGLGEQGEAVAARVVERLSEAEPLARRRAGARLALDLGVREGTLTLVQEIAGELDGRSRETFLADVGRRARDGGQADVASWAYDELGEEATSPAERREFDRRIVEAALAGGDTATALEAQRRLAESFSAGSVDRRRAVAEVIRLEGFRSDPEELRAMLTRFREDFPHAPETDALAATVSAALQARGDIEAAAAVLEGVEGPQSSLERAYLLLAEGDVEGGRGALLLALTGLAPTEATPVIQLAGLLGRLSPPAALALSEAGVVAHRGDPAGAAEALAAAVDSLAEEERAPVLAQAARIAAEGGASSAAAGIRLRIVDDFPDSPEMGEASLALARHYARRPDGVDRAIRLLEDLITQRPNAAVVPDARVELQRLRGRG